MYSIIACLHVALSKKIVLGLAAGVTVNVFRVLDRDLALSNCSFV